ncbi:acyl carrier protein [Streptomyces thinghirensis]|nr:acyl carrier protein [Streptomyces thinghirensis]
MWADGERTLSSQGAHTCRRAAERPAPSLAELRAACAGAALPLRRVRPVRGCARHGVRPGAQRSLSTLTVGTDARVAPRRSPELRAAPDGGATDAYVLHPSILDGTLPGDDRPGARRGTEARPPRGPRCPSPSGRWTSWPPHPGHGVRLDPLQGRQPARRSTSAKLDTLPPRRRGTDVRGADRSARAGTPRRRGPEDRRSRLASPAAGPPYAPRRARAAANLRDQLALAFEVAPERLDVDTPLEFFGMDSMMAMDWPHHLESTFGDSRRPCSSRFLQSGHSASTSPTHTHRPLRLCALDTAARGRRGPPARPLWGPPSLLGRGRAAPTSRSSV